MARVQIAIFGATPGQGATATSLNVAAALAGMGKTVLLVDADPEGTMEAMPGLSEFGSALDREGRLVARSASTPGLSVLTRLGSLLTEGNGAAALERVALFTRTMDAVIYDAPADSAADALIEHCDFAFIVTRPTVDALTELPRALERMIAIRSRSERVRLGGLIVNMKKVDGGPEQRAADSALTEVRAAFPDALAGDGLPFAAAIARSRSELTPAGLLTPPERGVSEAIAQFAHAIARTIGLVEASPRLAAVQASATATARVPGKSGGLLGWLAGRR